MARPYFNSGGGDLERLFLDQGDDLSILIALRDELVHRKTPKMRALREKVLRKLAAIQDPAPHTPPSAAPSAPDRSDSNESPAPVSRPAQSPHARNGNGSADNSASTEDRGNAGFTAGRLGTIRPCGGLTDVPQRRRFERKTELQLDIPANASLTKKYTVALAALIREMRRKGSGAKRIAVENGVSLTLDGKQNGYKFRLDGDEELFEGAALTAIVGSVQVAGQIVSASSGELVVSLDENFGPAIAAAILQIDNTAMLEALLNRLDKIEKGEAQFNSAIATRAITNEGEAHRPASLPPNIAAIHSLNSRQAAAVGMALSNDVAYLWGPPGTGKTASLTALLDVLFSANKRVLICSNTNQAVDQVLLKLCRRLETNHPALADGKVVRIGRIQHEELRDEFHNYVTLDGIVERKSAALHQEKLKLEEAVQRIRGSAEQDRTVVEQFHKLDAFSVDLERLDNEKRNNAGLLADTQIELRKWLELERQSKADLETLKQAGVLKRLIMRSEAQIQSDIEIAQREQRNAAEKKDGLARTIKGLVEHIDAATTEIRRLRDYTARHDRRAAEGRLAEAESTLSPLLSRLSEIGKQLGDIAQAVMQDARIIGATVTKAYLSPKSFVNFDAVIIDEASMVMLPALYHAAGLAKERVTISGDFRQLAPIVPTDESAIAEVIGIDVFHAAGVAEKCASGDVDGASRTVMLDVQYRMSEPICNLISGRMYQGRLATGETKERKRSQAPPEPFSSTLTIVDTSPIMPFVNRDALGSRFNLWNAIVIRNLCRHLAESGFVVDGHSLGACSPYAAQAKLLKRVLGSLPITGKIEAATVHRYQGDEKTAIILDIPDSLGEPTVGMFLEADGPDENGARLFNVAVSRAEQHLIFVCNLAYLDRKLPDRSFVREILSAAQLHGRVVDARDIVALWPVEEELQRIGQQFDLSAEAVETGLFRDKDFQSVCRADIAAARRSVAIFSGFVTPQRTATYASLFQSKLTEGVAIRCVTRPPRHNGSIPEEQGKETLDALEAMGCIVDTRWDIHEKVIIVDDEIIWFGSLNPLSHTGQTDEMMARLEGRPAALQLAAFLSLSRNLKPEQAAGISTAKENPPCGECEGRTTYRKGRYGAYWECETACGWTESVDRPKRNNADRPNPLSGEPAPECPKCGGSTAARMGRFGPFWGCTAYPRCNGIINPSKKKSRKTSGSRRSKATAAEQRKR